MIQTGTEFDPHAGRARLQNAQGERTHRHRIRQVIQESGIRYLHNMVIGFPKSHEQPA